jgi:hypothetical protein
VTDWRWRASTASNAEAASALALRLGSPPQSVKSILESGRDRRPTTSELPLELPAHGNVRGPGYYH